MEVDSMSQRVPHTVPRGLLRFYILRLLTKRAMKGYEVITEIENRTDRVWRPGPGSIYPMLGSMKKEGLIHSAHSARSEADHRRGTTLQITEKGRQELSRFRENLKRGMPTRARSLYLIFADIAYPGLAFDEVVLAEREREIQRLEHVFSDQYWATVTAENRKEFVERYSKIVQKELELVRAKLISARNKQDNA
jgi:DNA-binding PadR family transcriptional regulator